MILITHYMEEVIDADKIYADAGSRAGGNGRNAREVFSQVKIKKYRLDVPR